MLLCPHPPNIHSWYTNLTPRTRLVAGAAVMAYACGAMYLSDMAEPYLGLKPSEADEEKLRKMVPHISVVEKEDQRRG